MTAPAGAGVRATGLAVAVMLLAAVTALAVVTWAGRSRADFGGGSLTEVERAIATSGLQVCAAESHRDGLAPGAVESRTYELAVDCSGERARAVVDRFPDVEGRDAAAQRFESLTRPRGSGVVWTLGDTTVLLTGAGDQDVRDRLGAALAAAGAR